MKLKIFVQGEPKAQPRPRAFARRFGDKWQARVYDCGSAEAWKSQIAVAAKPHIPESPLTGAITLAITFFIRRPKGHSGAKGLKPSAPAHHTQKPDVDNLFKSTTDALTQIGMWSDDAVITDARVSKRWALKHPGAVIEIESEEQQPDLTLAPTEGTQP